MANTNSLQLFDGASQYLYEASASSLLRITGNLTIEFWAKPYYVPTTKAFLEKGDGSGFQSYRVWIDSSGYVKFEISKDGVNFDILGASNPIPIDGTTWSHIAVVYDSGANTMYLYINSALSNSNVLGGANSIASYATELRVGTKDGANYYNYLLDEIRVWNTARSQPQIQTNYQRELAGNESGLIAYWKFDNNYNDSTPNGLTLSPSGLPTFLTDVPFTDNTTTSTTTTSTSSSTSTTTTSTSTTTTSTSTSTSTTTTTSTSTSTTTTSTTTTKTTTSTTTTSTSTTTTSTSTTTTSTSTSTTTSTSTSTTMTIDLRLIVEKVK